MTLNLLTKVHLTLMILFLALAAHAGTISGPDKLCVLCGISGTTPIQAPATATYSLKSSCSATSWTVTASLGTIQTSTANYVIINWVAAGTATITALSSGTVVATLTVTVTSPPPAVGGTISNPSQTINYNNTPAPIDASVSSGGNCTGTITYQWMSSTNNSTFSNISGATSQNYQPPALTTTTYFKRYTACSESYTTNTATVTVYPQLVVGNFTTSPVKINYDASPGTLSCPTVSGGSGSYTYQWLYASSASGPWNLVPSGGTSTTYPPGNLTATTYYECSVSSNGAMAVSGVLEVEVYPQLLGGTLTPAVQTVYYGSQNPQWIVDNTASGGLGSGSYGFTWYSSPDSIHWTVVAPNYMNQYVPASAITAPLYIRAMVNSNGDSTLSSVAKINLYPPILGGSITPALQTINYNTSATELSVSTASGGYGTYEYVWQSSLDSMFDNPTTITIPDSATFTSWPPGTLTSTTYFRVAAYNDGGPIPGYSSIARVIVNPQVMPGTINPSSITLTPNTSPGVISAFAATGGACNGSYTYQWQQSTNGVNFSAISGATGLSIEPGSLSSTMYYRRQVACGTDTEYTNVCQITMGTVGTDLNYIRSRTLHKPGVTDTVTADQLTSPYDAVQSTDYFDGLGRPLQTVQKQVSPLQNDIVTIHVYDGFGRESAKYMPYTSPTNDGNYKVDPMGEQSAYLGAQFPGEQLFYSQTVYEPSPLNRPQSVYAPGNSWIGSSRGMSQQYLYNTAADSVQKWTINSVPESLPVVTAPYSAGQLYKDISTDEAGNQIIQYVNPAGELILKRAQISPSPGTGHSGWLNTYYVYDTLQNLRFVIQPQAVQLIDGSWTISQGIANELCFRYEYDARHRIIIKKSAGAGEVWLVYDARDRVIMTQDSSLRVLGKWMVIKYDSLNRKDSTGLLTNSNNRAYHQNLAYNITGYPNTSSNFELLTATWFDNYNWVSTTGTALTTTMATGMTGNSKYFITSYGVSPSYAVAITPNYQTRNLITGTMSKVIGTTSQYLYAETFYDDHKRAIQTRDVNYTGAPDTLTTQYDFSGKVLRTLVSHQKAGNTTQGHTVVTKVDYDQSARIRHVWKNIDNAAADQIIDSIQYNESGQVRAKYIGSNSATGGALDSLVYTYNIRAWLTGINKQYLAGTATNYFGEELGYDNPTSVTGTTSFLNSLYNGNIAGTIWKSAGSGISRKYDYTYDNANRLTSAAFLQNTSGSTWDNATTDYSVSNLTYDANGNILTMHQNGFKVGGSGPIDQLGYTYQSNSNKLQEVYDTANDPNSVLGDFHYNPATKTSTDYGYDGNGNLILDNNKGISSITYNFLNLPQQVHINGKGNITFTYDAKGHKLQKLIMDSTSMHSTRILYLAGFVYQQSDTITNAGGGTDTLQFMTHEEGRARWAFHKYLNGSTAYGWEYDFFETDHLGNTRVLLSQEKDTAQYIATMEAAFRNTEDQLFYNIPATSYARASVPGYPVDTTVTNPNDSVAQVNASFQKVGPAIILKVMSGDKVDIGVQYYYNNFTDTSSPALSATDLLSSLASGIVSLAGATHGTLAQLNTPSGPLVAPLTSFLNNNNPQLSGKPQAYLNWVLLDDQFNYVSSYPQSGAIPVGAAGTQSNGQLQPALGYSGIPITKSGYLYVYVSNATPGWDVYFDNLSVKTYSGPLVEENHYYPYGLTMAGISDKAVKPEYAENKYRFNQGCELQNKEFSDGTGLELYDATMRSFDPQLGRFGQLDPLSSTYASFSSYSYSMNNPVLYNDVTGAGPQDPANPQTPPQTFDDVQDLIDYIDDNGISSFGNGFTSFLIDQDGDVSSTLYDANPTEGWFNGVQGIWINANSAGAGPTTGYFSRSQDAFTGSQLTTFNFVHKFISMPSLMDDYNAYTDRPGFWDYAGAAGNILAGGAELAAIYLSGGTMGFLAVDAVGRMVNGVGALYTMGTEGVREAKNMPTNLGGDIGALITGQAGSQLQKQLQLLDDAAAFYDGAGLVGDTNEALEAMEQQNLLKFGVGAANVGFGAKDLKELPEKVNDATGGPEK